MNISHILISFSFLNTMRYCKARFTIVYINGPNCVDELKSQTKYFGARGLEGIIIR